MLTVGLVAFLLGTMIGLLARPALDAYLYWKSADLFRREHHAEAPSDRVRPQL